MTTQVLALNAAEVTETDVAQMAALSALCFPDPGRSETARAESISRTLAENIVAENEIGIYVVRSEGRIVACARAIPRTIAVAEARLRILALCGVMSHPQVRGKGLGKAVVLKAFSRVDSGEFPFSVFQTKGARGFYENLGCAVVQAPVVNSLNQTDPCARPLWDPWLMSYPGAGWPEGEVDLLGAAW